MSLNKIAQLITSLSKTIDNNEGLSIPLLLSKATKYSKLIPEDKSLGAIVQVLDKMDFHNKSFISKAEFKDLCAKSYTVGTKINDVFSNEIGIKKEILQKKASVESKVEINPYQSADPILVNALESVFDKKIPLKIYSKDIANKAINHVSKTLDMINFKPNNITVEAGNENFLVIKANYETPRGKTGFIVPIETTNNKISVANIFIGNSGLEELNHTNIKKYIRSTAGDNLNVNASIVLDALVKSVDNNKQLNSVEWALIKLNNSKRQEVGLNSTPILGYSIDAKPKEDVKIQKSNEFESFEKKFSSPQGIALFTFGESKIKTARDLILRDLNSFGYKNAQVSITSVEKNKILFGVNLEGKVAFTVPIKIDKTKIDKPSMLISNGSIAVFNKESINNLYTNNINDYKVAAKVSLQYELKPSEILDNIRESVNIENYAKAEDALNVLAQAGDEKNYINGFAIYINGLNGKNKEVECKCNLIIKSSSSRYPICGHTNLPTHKVYQDQYGNCHPLYRRNTEESKDKISFGSNNILID